MEAPGALLPRGLLVRGAPKRNGPHSRPASRLTLSSRIKPPMPDEKPITDPEKIAAYVRSARIVYGLDDDGHDPGEIDNPPTVVKTPAGAKVRAWVPVAALSQDDEIELDEQRAVKTTPSGGVVARVWLPVSVEDLVGWRAALNETAAESPGRRARQPRATHLGDNLGRDGTGAATQSGDALGCSETLTLRQPRDPLTLLHHDPGFVAHCAAQKMKTPRADVGDAERVWKPFA
jgi:hypothetical protein